MWKLNETENLNGKVALITGGNSGIGSEAVKVLSNQGATVILASRNVQKGETAKKDILNELGKAHIEVMPLDLSDLGSVREFTNLFKHKYNRLDVLLNNAGLAVVDQSKTKDGFETDFGVNHLGHFALTGLLLDTLKQTENARVVTISSEAHASGKIEFDDLMFKNRKFNAMVAYGQSKLANLLFTYELQRRFKENNMSSISLAAHPGTTKTNFRRYASKLLQATLSIASPQHDINMGVLPGLRAALDTALNGGTYLGPKKHNDASISAEIISSSEASYSLEDAKKLWEVSEKLTQVQYKF
ncbi:MAG: oxidoreductase [Ostreibacterium sp.]